MAWQPIYRKSLSNKFVSEKNTVLYFTKKQLDNRNDLRISTGKKSVDLDFASLLNNSGQPDKYVTTQDMHYPIGFGKKSLYNGCILLCFKFFLQLVNGIIKVLRQ